MRQGKPSLLGIVVKLSLMGLLDAIGVYAIYLMAAAEFWTGAGALTISLIGINWLYFTERAVPLKYLLPGLITMIAFGLIPIGYTIYIAFTNYSTGHVMSKPEAIEAIERDGFVDKYSYMMQMATDPEGEITLLLQKYDGATYEDLGSFYGTPDGLVPAEEPFPIDEFTFAIIPPDGYTPLSEDEAIAWVEKPTFTVPVEGGNFVATTAYAAAEQVQRWVYDPVADTFTDTTCGEVYKVSDEGNFVGTSCDSGEEYAIEKGWMVGVGLDNFSKIFTNPRYSEPMLRVFIWTVVYAFSSVFLTFTVGMLIAFLFNTPVMRFRKIYRSLLIIPYAIPGFLSILVWRGLLNDDFGAVNNILGLTIPWLTDPTCAKISILLVNTWLGFPYMFLVATGALQAIPAELKEAAQVDGANRVQAFRHVTLPLLLVAVGPLLVGSFSYNFNNFNQIYLLTQGGPELADTNTAAGATDILISYTYKLAFVSGMGQNYALSSAVSILLFLIIGSLSFWSFRRSKALENMS
jgi:arabinogalactan oligomer/maltooligosaccharide transport system permease protein